MTEYDRIDRQIDIDASAERVWALVSTPGWWINDGTIVDHEIERRGDLDVVHDPKHGAFPLRTEKLDPPRYAAFRWIPGRSTDELEEGASTLTEFWIEEREGGGSRAARRRERVRIAPRLGRGPAQAARREHRGLGHRAGRGADGARSSMSQASVAEVFAALGDPNRQRLLELIADRGRATATTLAAPVAVTRQAVDKHLRVLERAGLVAATREGREVLYSVRRDELDRTAAWLTQLGATWDRRLAAIKELAEAGEPPRQ